MLNTVAFFSYRRPDDEATDGLISKIHQVMQNRLVPYLGEDVEIFLDTDDIKTGDDWPERLQQALDAANYLIPILSPNFFKSDYCRRELERFFEKEDELNRYDMVLPVYLFEIPNYSIHADDELIAKTARRNHENWLAFNASTEVDQEFRSQISKFADQLKEKVLRDEERAKEGVPQTIPAPEVAVVHMNIAADVRVDTEDMPNTEHVTQDSAETDNGKDSPAPIDANDLQDPQQSAPAASQELIEGPTALTSDKTGSISPPQDPHERTLKPDVWPTRPATPPRKSYLKTALAVATICAGLSLTLAFKNGFFDQTPDAPSNGAALGVFRDCTVEEGCPEMVLLSDGSFMMGAPDTEAKSYNRERPVKKRTMKSFAIAKTEFSIESWSQCVADGFCQETAIQKSHYKCRDPRCPAVNLTWNDAHVITNWLNSKITGAAPYRLPTEAEWEYAARAGTTTAFSFGDVISTSLANYKGDEVYKGSEVGDFQDRPLVVDSFPSNPWGLLNVHGNVWEWVADCANNDFSEASEDGQAALSDLKATCPDGKRVQKSGSYSNFPWFLRSATRIRFQQNSTDNKRGFRPARDVSDIPDLDLRPM